MAASGGKKKFPITNLMKYLQKTEMDEQALQNRMETVRHYGAGRPGLPQHARENPKNKSKGLQQIDSEEISEIPNDDLLVNDDLEPANKPSGLSKKALETDNATNVAPTPSRQQEYMAPGYLHGHYYPDGIPSWAKRPQIEAGQEKIRRIKKTAKIEAQGFLSFTTCDHCTRISRDCKVLGPFSETSVVKCSSCVYLGKVCSLNTVETREELKKMDEQDNSEGTEAIDNGGSVVDH